MRHRSTLVFEYESAARARTVERSLSPEIGAIQGDRTGATLERDDATITIDVAAADLTALRAGHNTWLTLVEVAERGAVASEGVTDERDA